MSDEFPEAGRSVRWSRTIPGWVLLGLTVFLLVTRDGVSETLVGTLLGFSCVLLGIPIALPGKR